MITLQFVTSRGFESATIRWATWCDISHVDFVMPNGTLLGALTRAYGAPAAGVQIRQAGYNNWKRIIRVEYDATQNQYDRYQDWLLSQVGKPYDKIGITEFMFHQYEQRNWREESAWFCSELQARASEIAGCPFLNFEVINPYKIDPRDLLLSQRIKSITVLK